MRWIRRVTGKLDRDEPPERRIPAKFRVFPSLVPVPRSREAATPRDPASRIPDRGGSLLIASAESTGSGSRLSRYRNEAVDGSLASPQQVPD